MKFDLADTDYDPLAWGSHLPSLLACLGATTGPVLELGVGHFSTPALHAFCRAARRELSSVEENAEWLLHFANKYENPHFFPTHEFLGGTYDEVVPMLARRQRWAVALIDNSPGGERRTKDFLTLLPVCDFVVVHDYERENAEAISEHLAGLPMLNFGVIDDYEPPTLIASQSMPMPI